MRESFKKNIFLDIVPILTIILTGMLSILKWRIGVIPAILMGVFISAVIANMRGESLKNIENAMAEGVKRVFPALLTVVLIGLIISSWIMAGIIPSIVFWGFKIINFNNFLPIVFIVTSIVAIITGTSFTAIGTIGVSFMIIARQVEISPEIVAGAIVSGAFLGDKMSPLSDTTNISATLAKTDLFVHIRYMLVDTIPAFIISLIGYKLINSRLISENVNMENINLFLTEVETMFNVSPLLFFIPLIVIFLGLKRVPSIIVLFSAVFMGIISGLFFQSFKVVDIIKNTVLGTKLEFINPLVSRLFSKGGVNEVSGTAIIVMFIGCLVGIIFECNLFQNLLTKIQTRINTSKQLTFGVFISSLIIGLATGAQLLAIVLPASIFLPLFNKFRLKNKNLSRIVEATGTVGITLIPWSVPGIFIARTLEIDMLKVIPFLFFPISVVLVNLILNITEIGIARIKDTNNLENEKIKGIKVNN